jgi:hypothetical protein
MDPSGNNMLHDDDILRLFSSIEASTQQIDILPGYNHRADGMNFIQFTGLQDKKSVLIFEGDIVK